MAQERTVAENHYGRYSVPEGIEHRPAVRMVRAGGVYEPDTIAFMRDYSGAGDIVHAGTFFGDFLPGISAAMAKGARIWAFEPNPDSYQHACETIRLNGLGNIELANRALSDSMGEILFRTRDVQGNPMGGHAHFTEENGSGVEKVPAVMLDYAVPLDRPVSILQLDVEGHEAAALLGAYHILHKWRPILVLEDFNRPRWLRKQFPQLGYRKERRLHGNWVYLPEGREL
jgi:FkbM family methyltransferase